MAATLFLVHGSHPCATVERALALKGIDHRVVEWPPPLHAPLQTLLFRRRTVPGIRFDGGERVSGSRAILRRLDELVPEPPLLPSDPAARERVLEAERWGDEVLQAVVRRVLWYALGERPTAIPSFQEHSRLPIPKAALPLMSPMIVAVEQRMNHATPAGARADLADLPGHLDRIDGWLADGTLGGARENAADLQIAASLRLLMTLEDLREPLAARPAGQLALRIFPQFDGHVPAGTLPADWLTSLSAPATPPAKGRGKRAAARG
ncbi:Glutathione S-transferase zeta class [Patulibacter medicamentivorans]|uniref:Glutathione S-transferase zeta class n=1 Tax=Patulibacter medicamentivorans TaxID=1097667 RepID=H0E1F4_9ACTN|nr:glutathione S-transferase family protein [Patulibacter medicamentivorans]EHN12508.1 Glutathione S-transferase zeta class [Patulibacter medicamentivorans]